MKFNLIKKLKVYYFLINYLYLIMSVLINYKLKIFKTNTIIANFFDKILAAFKQNFQLIKLIKTYNTTNI
jgi:hypothetical protein